MLNFRDQVHEGCGQQNTTTEGEQRHHHPVSSLEGTGIFSRHPLEFPSQQQRGNTTYHGSTEQHQHRDPLGEDDSIGVIFVSVAMPEHQAFDSHFG